MEDELKARWEKIWEITNYGGQNTLQYFQKPDVGYERKSDHSPVTIADKDTEEKMRAKILGLFPNDSILGEEFGDVEGDSGFRWILDPIDGTKAFIGGVPLYGTMVGLEVDGGCVAGGIAVPGIGEGIYACKGQGAWHVTPANMKNGTGPVRAHVSSAANLSQSILASAEPRSFQTRGALDTLMDLDSRTYFARNWGDCYGYMLVATGKVEVMIDPIMSLWDAAAVQPIVEEAGGTFTDWNGEPTVYNGEGIATNGKVLEEVLEVSRKAAPYSPA